MDNYLSYRWPERDPEHWTPERPRPPRRRRLARNLFVALLLVVAVAGVALGGWYLVEHTLKTMARTASASASLPESPARDLEPAPSQTPEPSLPRASTGLGVTLELDHVPRTALSAREIYELVLPSVVSVRVQTGSGYGTGSGVVMGEDGYILTNYHVIAGATAASVMLLEDNALYSARLVGYDQELDVAVLKIDCAGLTAARFGDSDQLRVGDTAYAIGNPMGYLYGSMSDGIISFVDRAQTIEDTEMTLIQTTAVLNSGNSGGALVNERGQVVGITVAKISGSASYNAPQVEGLGFAIPISAAKPFIDRILDAGETWRPVMGVMCQVAEVDGATGIQIKSVTPDGPADLAGLQAEDLILFANGKPATSVYALKRVLNDAGVGGPVEFTVLRAGERLELTAVLVDSAELDGG